MFFKLYVKGLHKKVFCFLKNSAEVLYGTGILILQIMDFSSNRVLVCHEKM